MAEYWSYNGYTLPRLPAGWDMQKYPYAIILGVKSAFGFNLVCHSELPTVRTVNGENVIGFNIGTKVQSFTFNRASDTDWVDKGEVTPTPSDSSVTWYYYDNDATEFVWCNNDIKDESGNTVYAASVPVPIAPEEPEDPEPPAFDLTAWLTGYALGLCGKPLPMSQKEPVAYLYNGVRLPKLPEWDRETYPYVAMLNQVYRVVFIAYSDPMHLVLTSSSGGMSVGVKAGETFLQIVYWTSNDTIPDFEEKSLTYDYLLGTPDWANYDVQNADGTVYLAASEPVPVYE